MDAVIGSMERWGCDLKVLLHQDPGSQPIRHCTLCGCARSIEVRGLHILALVMTITTPTVSRHKHQSVAVTMPAATLESDGAC
jgi:hypothetical protein